MQQGMQQGRADLLLELLQERFGLVPESVREVVNSARLDEINGWAKRVIRADSLQAVFQSSGLTAG